MPGDSPEVKTARMGERLTTVLRELEQARDGRKQQYKMIEKINHTALIQPFRVAGDRYGSLNASSVC